MDWHYAGKNDEPIGPISESQMADLLQRQVISADTLVWSDGLPDWLPLGRSSLAPPGRAVPPPIRRPPNSAPTGSTAFAEPSASASFERDPNKVYPSNPPRSPNLCFLNILLPGSAQIALGQTGKGLLLILGNVGLFYFLPPWYAWLAFYFFSIGDAHSVAVKLRKGQAVDKWHFYSDY